MNISIIGLWWDFLCAYNARGWIRHSPKRESHDIATNTKACFFIESLRLRLKIGRT